MAIHEQNDHLVAERRVWPRKKPSMLTIAETTNADDL
jgi:hypothetical protein